MCGVAGMIDFSGARDTTALDRTARAMADALVHRGPDGCGVWHEPDGPVALSHRRLAIIDLTETGAQPMSSADGRWVMSYNGEVYNAEQVAAEPHMDGLVRRGSSDTEIVLESVARIGLERTLEKLNGMFAIALWDRMTRTLHLIRDRLGIKPLAYVKANDGLWFASELKAFAAVGLSLTVDPSATATFLRFACVPAPYSIYHEVKKLKPGEIVSVTATGQVTRQQYWSADAVAQAGLAAPFAGSEADAEEQLHALLADAVAGQMVSDVPLGVFLSGGVDSSTVAALMVASKRSRVRTFSIGFSDLAYDESSYARAVARHLDTEHHELTVSTQDALDIVPQLAEMYDEPFADSSQIPTHLISKLSRAFVTVALSGDGGDEVFAGYNRYTLGHGLGERLATMPRFARYGLAAALRAAPEGFIDAAAKLAPRHLRPSQPAVKLKKLASVLPLERDAFYAQLLSQCPDPAALMCGARELDIGLGAVPRLGPHHFVEQLQLFDTLTYLPDDILQKVDRASMAVSLEVRPPLLDHSVVEFAWRLPRRFKIRGGETKHILRRILYRYVPRGLIERPKMGFAVPLAAWLRGPLRDWAEDLLDPVRLGGGLFDTRAVRTLWDQHQRNDHNWAYALWTILMYESWRRRWASPMMSSQSR